MGLAWLFALMVSAPFQATPAPNPTPRRSCAPLVVVGRTKIDSFTISEKGRQTDSWPIRAYRGTVRISEVVRGQTDQSELQFIRMARIMVQSGSDELIALSPIRDTTASHVIVSTAAAPLKPPIQLPDC